MHLNWFQPAMSSNSIVINNLRTHTDTHTQTHTDTVHTSSKCIQTWAQCLCVITYRGLNTCEHHAHADTHTVYNHTRPASNWLNNTLSVE